MWVRFGLHAVEVLVVLSIPRTWCQARAKAARWLFVGAVMGLFVVMPAGEVSCTMAFRIGTPNWLGGSVQAPGRSVQAPPRG